MATVPYTSNLDLGNNEIQNAKFQMLPSAPSAAEALFYYDTTLKKFGYYNGSEWIYGTVYIEGNGISINGNVISVDTDVIATVAQLAGYVPTSRTINGKSLTGNINLTAADIGALSDSTTINDLTTSAQQAALNSGATSANIGQIATNTSNISDIQGLIPTQASTTNQLADKDFVNSSISTNTANFIGTFNSLADLQAYSGTLTNNDYAFVKTTDTNGNTIYQRYKYNAETSTWVYEYDLNNSSFTAAQWEAVNSGITSDGTAQIETNKDNIASLQSDVSDIQTALNNVPKKLTATNPALTVSGGVCTWSIANTLATNELNVSVYRIADGVQIMTEVDVSASAVVVKFNSTANITAGIYKSVIIG